MKTTKTLALIAAIVMVGAAYAQDAGGPPPPGDQGGAPSGMGRGPGGPGGMRHGPRMGGPMLLNVKEVQKELKLSDDQISQIKALMPMRRGPIQQGDEPPTPPKRLTREEMDAKLKSILSTDQFARFQQLMLQAQGPMAFGRPEVQEKLGLTSDQKSKIREIMDADRQTPPPTPGEQSDLRKAMKERREKLEREVTAVLTDDQKATWKSMIGAKFDFPAMRRIPGGRGGPGGHDDGQGGPPPMDGGGGPPPPPPSGDGE